VHARHLSAALVSTFFTIGVRVRAAQDGGVEQVGMVTSGRKDGRPAHPLVGVTRGIGLPTTRVSPPGLAVAPPAGVFSAAGPSM